MMKIIPNSCSNGHVGHIITSFKFPLYPRLIVFGDLLCGYSLSLQILNND